LLQRGRDEGDDQARDKALLTLRKMAEGGLFDQIGGGFFRYSMDAQWHIPHFEKMQDRERWREFVQLWHAIGLWPLPAHHTNQVMVEFIGLKTGADAAMPSGNGAAALALLALSGKVTEPNAARYRMAALRCVQVFAATARADPASCTSLLGAAMLLNK